MTATGEAVLGARGQIISLTGTVVEQLHVPNWSAPGLGDIDVTRRPVSGGVDGVGEDEVAAFLGLIAR